MPDPKRPLKVFLCHASQDKPAVRELSRRLFAEGWIDPWLDEKKLLPGQDWRLEIEDAVETSDIILICLSSNSVTKEGFVQKEMKYARDMALEKPDGTIFLIPLRLDKCEIPRGLRSFQWVDYFGERELEAYSALIESLRLRHEQKLRLEETERIRREERVESQRGKESVQKMGFQAPTPESPKTEAVAAPVSASTQISAMQRFPAPGSNAEGLTWDGASLWVSDNSGVIFRLDPSGDVLDSVRSPDVTPQGLTWDGSSLWVYTTNRSLLYQVQVDGGNARTVGSFRSPGEVVGGGITQDMAWDGKHLWYANQFKVYKLDRSGERLGSFTFPKHVSGLSWDGTNLWIAYNDFPEKANLSRVDVHGEILETYILPIGVINGLAWADGCLWALGSDSVSGKPMIYKLNMPTK